MSIDEIIKRLERIERALANPEQLAQQPALDLAQAVADRVIEEGRSAEGDKFSAYSDVDLPAFFYFNRSANQAGEGRVRQAAKERKSISYRDFRNYNNRPTDKKNFSFTQDMWRNFGVRSIVGAGGNLSIVLGAKSESARKKIAWNSQREGVSIIKPSAAEVERFAKSFAQKILNV